MQILANQAPIGFEAEFVNQRSATILYRGILLPYSSDGETIDFIYGVINWKEMADQITTDELLLEIDQVLDPDPLDAADTVIQPGEPVADWADGPGAAHDLVPLESPIADLPLDEPGLAAVSAFPEPAFGLDGDDFAAQGEADAVDPGASEDAIVSRMSSLNSSARRRRGQPGRRRLGRNPRWLGRRVRTARCFAAAAEKGQEAGARPVSDRWRRPIRGWLGRDGP